MLKGKVWLKDQILSPKIYSSQSDRGQGYRQEIQEKTEGEGKWGDLFPFGPRETKDCLWIEKTVVAHKKKKQCITVQGGILY